MSLVSSAFAATLLVWPRLETLGLAQALIWLIAPHMFLRFIGLSFLMPGVVSLSLPREWSLPAACGDSSGGPPRDCHDGYAGYRPRLGDRRRLGL